MEYIFNMLDAETAHQITLDKNIQTNSVTLEEDVYNPSETLEGGSKTSSAGLLIDI